MALARDFTGGCVPGDIVLMRLGNTVDFPIAYLGALAVGLVPVPTSAALTSTEVAHIVAELRPRIILRDGDVASAPGAPEMRLATLRALRHHPAAPWDMGDPERLGYIVYTSGTSGVPRAVSHAHRAIWARRMMHQGWYSLSRDEFMMHAGGCRVSPLEVESALIGAPGVTAVGCAQVEVKPGVWIIVAFYTSAHALDETRLRAYVEPKLAGYKHPRAYIRIDQMPTGANGKLRRNRLHLFWPKD